MLTEKFDLLQSDEQATLVGRATLRQAWLVFELAHCSMLDNDREIIPFLRKIMVADFASRGQLIGNTLAEDSTRSVMLQSLRYGGDRQIDLALQSVHYGVRAAWELGFKRESVSQNWKPVLNFTKACSYSKVCSPEEIALDAVNFEQEQSSSSVANRAIFSEGYSERSTVMEHFFRSSNNSSEDWSFWIKWLHDRLNGFVDRPYFLDAEASFLMLPDGFYSNGYSNVNHALNELEIEVRGLPFADGQYFAEGYGFDRPDDMINSLKDNVSKQKVGSISLMIERDTENVDALIEGLKKLVMNELQVINSVLPNSEDAKHKQNAQTTFLEKLLDGLEGIKTSLSRDTPVETEQQVKSLMQRITDWYLLQPIWAQRAVRATGILSVAAPFAATGLPAWLTVAVPAAFFAKEEISDLKDIIKGGSGSE